MDFLAAEALVTDQHPRAEGAHCGELFHAFDYCSPAELFTGKRKGGSRQRLRYRRFATAAEAIRFVTPRPKGPDVKLTD